MLTEKQLKRFQSFFCPDPVSGCWLWDGCADNKGYGVFGIRKKCFKSHRISFMHFKGVKLSRQEQVNHKCNNSFCVNPDHLYVGTHKDNMQDMVKAGRQCKGTSCHTNILSESDVYRIRDFLRIGKTAKFISRIIGCSMSTVYDIKHGRSWAHI